MASCLIPFGLIGVLSYSWVGYRRFEQRKVQFAAQHAFDFLLSESERYAGPSRPSALHPAVPALARASESGEPSAIYNAEPLPNRVPKLEAFSNKSLTELDANERRACLTEALLWPMVQSTLASEIIQGHRLLASNLDLLQRPFRLTVRSVDSGFLIDGLFEPEQYESSLSIYARASEMPNSTLRALHVGYVGDKFVLEHFGKL